MTPLIAYLLIFLVIGSGFILVHLLAGKLIRPSKPQAEKGTIYECGEPTIGSAWVQFDLRYYVVALLFVIFDVEVAFFFPWAEVFGTSNKVASLPAAPAEEQVAQYGRAMAALTPDFPENAALREQYAASPGSISGEDREADRAAMRQLSLLALLEIAVFFGVLLVGFAYLWKRGDLAWVRSTAAPQAAPPSPPVRAVPERELVGAARF